MDRTRENHSGDPEPHEVRNAGNTGGGGAEPVNDYRPASADGFGEAQATFTERACEYVQSTEVYVRNNPWQAVVIAGSIGLALGLLMSRR